MPSVVVTREGPVAHIRLNRPQALNAITLEMDDLLHEAWTTVNDEAAIRCAVLSAEGERSFCIGADVSGGVERGTRMAVGGGITGVGGAWLRLRKPLVAAVHGFCVGSGFELAMSADIIVAAQTAQFGLPETKVGIMAECGVLHRALRQLPHRVAMAMILTGDRIGAETATHFGLVNQVVPAAGLAAATQEWAERIVAAAPANRREVRRAR